MSDYTDHFYTPLEEAVADLQERREDHAFIEHVDQLFGTDVPKALTQEARAVLSRSIATPNNEFMRFLNLSAQTGFTPLSLEFQEGKFVAKNHEKYHLCRLVIEQGTSPEAYTKARSHNLVHFNEFEGKRFSEISTTHGEPLIDFHHSLLRENTPTTNNQIEVADFSDWFLSNRGIDPWTYYIRFLSLFMYRGILFENFLTATSEASFTETVVKPSFRMIEDVAGKKPLVVRLLPKESENDPYWCYYQNTLSGLPL